MNSVVAIGGASLLKVVKAYRELVPSAVWVLGLKTSRDLNDPNIRSLDLLIEPLMQSYFAAEAQTQVAAISAQLTTLLLRAKDADPAQLINAVSATLRNDVARALALVAMLDRAHSIQPVELVLNDGDGTLARTAIAWSRARSLPSVTLPADVPLGRSSLPSATRTIVFGERRRRAYRALDVDDSLLVHLSPGKAPFGAGADGRASARVSAKAALTRALGWPESDIVVLFEPFRRRCGSALEPRNGLHESLGAMFRAFVEARATVPALRLAIVGPPSAEGASMASQAAADAGVAAGEFAYGEAEHDVWMAAADIAVSVDSIRSIDAATAGVPAVNLWRPAGWYLGPAFAAEDGVVDVSPSALGATLAALASNGDLRTEIAAIAGDRIANEELAGQSVIAIAGELVKCRQQATAIASKPKSKNLVHEVPQTHLEIVKERHAAEAIGSKPRPDIVICAPPYMNGSAGLQALYRLCHFINLLGGNASMYPGTQLHPSWNTPRRNTEITDRTIVVYPEIFHHAFESKRIVRWCLNMPGLLGGPKVYGPNEMVFYFHKAYRDAAQTATGEVLTDERELYIGLVDPELFYNDRSRPRLYDCVFVYKGQSLYDRVQPRQMRDAYMIRGGWPATRAETAALLRGCRQLYSFDWNSAIVMEAVICGADVFLVGDDGFLNFAGYEGWHVEDYVEQYFDLAPVERFLRLLDERWGD